MCALILELLVKVSLPGKENINKANKPLMFNCGVLNNNAFTLICVH